MEVFKGKKNISSWKCPFENYLVLENKQTEMVKKKNLEGGKKKYPLLSSSWFSVSKIRELASLEK